VRTGRVAMSRGSHVATYPEAHPDPGERDKSKAAVYEA